MITEFGWSTLRWIGGEPVEDMAMGHLIVAKHRGYTNLFVPEHRRVCQLGCSTPLSSRLANDPKTGKLRKGWAERITRLRERLDGVNVEETNDRGEDGTASWSIEKSDASQASQ